MTVLTSSVVAKLPTAQILVLVVDDDAAMGEFICSAARGLSLNLRCEVTTRAVEFMAAFNPEVTLVVVDLVMPDMDGIELLRWLGQQRCKAGVLLMSGMDKRVLESADRLAGSLGLDVMGRLQKPFRLAQLEDVLRDCDVARNRRAEPPNPQIAVTREQLERAIARDEFLLHYQPQVEVATGRVVGFEALVRWQHPTLGLVFPDCFIEMAESFGWIDRLGWLVANRGLADAVHLRLREGRVPSLSLNVAAQSLVDLKFPDRFIALAGKYRVPPESIILEITESGLIENLTSALDILTRLRMKGIQLSIDDFGTGYAMMQQLRNIPATELKIDKSFVQEMHEKDASRIVVRKTIEIGHELGIKVVAEGVETSEQLEYLKASGCDLAQSYLFARPLPLPELL